MLWVRSKAVEVYLGPTTVGCRGLDDVDHRWADVSDLEDGLVCLREWLAELRNPVRARIWLATSLARPFVITVDSGARNTDEARELANAMAGEATGLDGELKVWLAPWRAEQMALAVAVSRSLLSSILALTNGRNGLRVPSVRPWWNPVLDAVIERSRDSARSIGWTIAEPDGLVQGRVVAGEVIEAAFEAPRPHDPESTMIRRRLEVGWGDVDEIEHLCFGRSAKATAPYAIGVASPLVSAKEGA